MSNFLSRALKTKIDCALDSGKFDVLAAVGIDNFAAIVCELGIVGYESFLDDLMNYLRNELKSEVYKVSFDSFFVVTKFHNVCLLSKLIEDCSLRIDGSKIYAENHIGYVVFKHRESELGTKAFMALKLAKEYQRFVCCYNTACYLVRSSNNKMKDIQAIRLGIEKQRAKLVCQPVVYTGGESICFYEGLLRLMDGKNQPISAGKFINQAEVMGVVRFIDDLVFKEALELLEVNSDLHLSVNVSVQSICNEEWLNRCINTISGSVLCDRLIIEITETAVSKNDKQVQHFISVMHGLKVRIAIDDFGSGNTSFVQLIEWPFDFVKVGDPFIGEVMENEKCREFISILVKMAHKAGAKVVAEMVRSAEQINCLRDLGVDLLQGNFIGEPVILKE